MLCLKEGDKLKCPYNRKSETHFQNWRQNPDENQTIVNGNTATQIVFELMDCEKENCGAWHDGKCCYAAVSLLNE